ncbi:MAG: hypothetical protein ACOYK7_14105 [Pirellulales bacterium]
MFVERSAGRIRLVRRLFILCGLAPLAGLVAVAAWRHGDTRRGWLEDRIAAALSAPVSIGAVTDSRPGVMVLEDVVVGDTAAGTGLAVRLARVRVEESTDEIRLAIDAWECPPGVAPVLARLLRAWQDGEYRFRRHWVVDCGRLGWGTESSAPALERVRVECVAADRSRAVRIHGVTAGGDGVDVRILRMQEGAGGEVRFEGELRFGAPVPAAVVAGVLGLGRTVGAATATLQGEARFAWGADGWSGRCSGVADGVPLGNLTAGLPYGVDGGASVAVDHAEIRFGRLVDARFECRAVRGTISRRLVAAAIDWLGCRPVRALSGDADIPYREMAWGCRLGDHGIELVGLGTDASILADEAGPLVAPPVGVMPADRLAWLVSPPGLPVVPASSWTGVLLPWLPIPTAGHAAPGRVQR